MHLQNLMLNACNIYVACWLELIFLDCGYLLWDWNLEICRKAGRLKLNFEMFQKSFNNVFRRVCFDIFSKICLKRISVHVRISKKTAIRNILSLRCMFFAKLCFMKHPCSDMKRSRICMKHPFPGMYEKMYVFFRNSLGFRGPQIRMQVRLLFETNGRPKLLCRRSKLWMVMLSWMFFRIWLIYYRILHPNLKIWCRHGTIIMQICIWILNWFSNFFIKTFIMIGIGTTGAAARWFHRRISSHGFDCNHHPCKCWRAIRFQGKFSRAGHWDIPRSILKTYPATVLHMLLNSLNFI